MKFIKHFFRKVNDREAAALELQEAYLDLLIAQTAVEYAQSIVNYNKKRSARLEWYLATHKEQK